MRPSARTKGGRRTLVVLGYASPLHPPEGVDVLRRPSDWGLSRWAKRWAALRHSVELVRRAHSYEHVLLVTGGVELFVLAPFLRSRLTAVDWLIPRSRRLDKSLFVRSVSFVVIRRQDAATLNRRFGVQDAKVRFVHFPAPALSGPTEDGGFVYSAGWAHRDWSTLLAAQRSTGLRTVIAAEGVHGRERNLDIVGAKSPEEGRCFLRAARVVAIPLLDTELPSGPLVLLDAMAHGKAVVVSDVGGSRDYVTDGVDAIVVPVGDPASLANALVRLDEDRALRQRLGGAAAARAATLTTERFWAEVLVSMGENQNS